MDLYQIEDHPDLVKDMDSRAILNTNYAALLEYKSKQKINDEIEELKTDVGQIKDMLSILLNSLNK